VNIYSLYGSKLKKKLGAQLNETASQGPNEFARSQLIKQGWTPGTGLGKRRDGRTSHIAVKQREEGAGIGTEKKVPSQQQQQQQQEWWQDSFSDTLAKLGGTKRSFTDEELFQATGGKRFSMRAAPTQNLHKWRRTEDDSGKSSPTTSENEGKNEKKKRKKGKTKSSDGQVEKREKKNRKSKEKKRKKQLKEEKKV
jgi:Pin2-interacting protein X1